MKRRSGPYSSRPCLGQDPRSAPDPAFTLVELLVVIAIMGILAALLLPVLARAKETSRSTTCCSNLRQLGIAAGVYSHDFKGQLPSFLDWLHPTNVNHAISNGTLYPFLRTADVYFCPTDKMTLAAKVPRGMPAASIRQYTYSMNCGLCHDADTSRYLASTRTLLFGEADLLWNDFSGIVGPQVFFGSPSGFSYRHNNATHFLFADFHYEQVKRPKAQVLQRSKRFWLPTSNDPFGFGPSLPYP